MCLFVLSCPWIELPPGRRLFKKNVFRINNHTPHPPRILPPSAPPTSPAKTLIRRTASPARLEWAASPQQKRSSPSHPPPRRRRGDGGGDREVSAHPFNPDQTERLSSGEVGNPLIWSLGQQTLQWTCGSLWGQPHQDGTPISAGALWGTHACLLQWLECLLCKYRRRNSSAACILTWTHQHKHEYW